MVTEALGVSGGEDLGEELEEVGTGQLTVRALAPKRGVIAKQCKSHKITQLKTNLFTFVMTSRPVITTAATFLFSSIKLLT